jgi:hypothetical protein
MEQSQKIHRIPRPCRARENAVDAVGEMFRHISKRPVHPPYSPLAKGGNQPSDSLPDLQEEPEEPVPSPLQG